MPIAHYRHLLALVPLALGGGEPAKELQTPMAIVILGALLSSLALNMVVLPALYWSFGERKVSLGIGDEVGERWQREADAAPARVPLAVADAHGPGVPG